MTGPELLERAQNLVLATLARNPSGMTNAEVHNATGLYLDVPKQKGYISWTILNHLIEVGKVEKVGPLYRIVRA